MKIVQIVPHIGNEASGPSYSTVRLSQSIAALGHEVVLLTVKDELAAETENFRLAVFPRARFPSSLWRSPALYKALLAESRSAEILHSHSLWVMPNVYPGWVAKKTSTPLVLSSRGTLSERALSHSAIRKRIFWHALQKNVVKEATCLHATSEQEYSDIRRVGLKQPVCIIANGIDIPDMISNADLVSDKTDLRTLLYLGRLHPIKGIDILIQVWSQIAAKRPNWRLRIVGPGKESYVNELKELVSALKAPRVEFIGAVFGNKKHLEYQRADLFVLPTHSENFGMTVAEALANGTPVVTTKNAPWVGLAEHGCGWWIDLAPDHLKSNLLEATAMESAELNEMGEKGRRWVSRGYNWRAIANQMQDVYNWLLSGGSRPECVMID